METITDYNKQSTDFLQTTGTTFAAKFLKKGIYFDGDKQARDIWSITLKNANHKYTFTFGQSIAHSGIAPTEYDVLACLQKYEVDDFTDFCNEFGYEQFDDIYEGHNRISFKIYKFVVKEWENIEKLFTPEQIELLQEIQ